MFHLGQTKYRQHIYRGINFLKNLRKNKKTRLKQTGFYFIDIVLSTFLIQRCRSERTPYQRASHNTLESY